MYKETSKIIAKIIYNVFELEPTPGPNSFNHDCLSITICSCVVIHDTLCCYMLLYLNVCCV